MAGSRLGKFGTLAALLLVLAGMTTLVSYSVTLYRLFCSVTGALGTTGRVAADTVKPQVAGPRITVTFDTNVAPDLPWRFAPVQHAVTLRPGQERLVFFHAENLSDKTLVGHATFNVSPNRVGLYFKKIQCFCFTEEKLGPHQSAEMPVDFFVDPRMLQDHNARDVRRITLSYTFFLSRKPKGAKPLTRFESRPPSASAGRKVFAEVCSACHGLARAKMGPPLATVYGRRAGSVPGYPYSPALAHAGFTWNAARLSRWLAGPERYLKGAEMPMALPDPLRREDVIAYLKSLSAPRVN